MKIHSPRARMVAVQQSPEPRAETSPHRRAVAQASASDCAVAAAAGVSAWLLVRTTLRAPVWLAVALVCVAFGAALARRLAGATSEVRLPLFAFFLGLCATRAFEFAWDLPRERALIVSLACALLALSAWVARRRARAGAALAALIVIAASATGERAAALSMVFALWLARVSARAWSAPGWGAWRWIAAVIAAAWAARGATIGPVALMIGASRDAGMVIEDERGATEDCAVWGVAVVGVLASRAWQWCPLIFL